MMRYASIAAAAGLLAACTTAGSDRPVCEALVIYDRQTQARAAAEISALPAGAALLRLIEDYGEMRARLRAACGR
jgi:hypothetical protein